MFDNASHVTMYFALHEAVLATHLTGGSAIAFCLAYLFVIALLSRKK